MSVQVQERRSFWDTPLSEFAAVDWEKVVLVVLLVLAVASRFWVLDARAYNHDESIHTSWSFDLYSGKGYIHNPIYHGPLLYHLTAATFFLLGDNDLTARVPNALFGIVLVALPFFFRKWLGKRGWIITSLILLLSPVVTYYSRFNRHDIYVEVFVVLMLLVIMKYYQARAEAAADGTGSDRSVRWLYAAAAVLALSYTAMETTFIFLALFAYFLTAAFTYDWLRHRGMNTGPVPDIVIAAIFGIPFFAVYAAYFTIVRIAEAFNIELRIDDTWRESPAYNLSVVFGSLSLPLILSPLFISLVLHRDPLDYSSTGGIFSSGAVLVFFIVLSAVIGLFWDWRKWLVCALLFYPIMIFFFTTVFTNPAGVGSGFIGSLGYWLSQQGVQRGSQPPYYYLMVLLPMYEYLPYLFGLLGLGYILYKRGQMRLGYFLVALLPLLAIVFYVWFTSGVLTAISQLSLPLLKGKDALQVGNTTVFLLGVLIPLYFALVYDPDNVKTRFTTLIGIWMIGVLVLFSWAGEKMPWLTMHLTIPLAFVSGYFMDRVLETDWRALYRQGALLFGLVLALAVLTLGFQIFFGPAPLSTNIAQIDQIARSASTIFSVVVVAICVFVMFLIGQNLGVKNSLRVVTVTVFAILAMFTIHSMALAAFENSDVAVETIIYAQGTPDEPAAMQEIQELNRRLCAQATPDAKVKINCDNGTVKVAYDDQSSWPFVWYLRNYRNAQYYGKSPSAPFDAEVVIVGPENEAAVKPFLGSKYVRRNMRLIWWPDEYYKDLTWTRLFGGTDSNGNAVSGLLVGDNLRSLIRDIWFYHKYPHSLSAWPYVHTFALYVRRDIATSLWQYAGVAAPTQPSTEQDPYLTKFLTNVQAQAAVGTAGAGNGQLSTPRNVALDSEGNVYVADAQNNRVEKFSASGEFVTQWGGDGSGPGQFKEPWGIAVDKQGTVYVADTWNHRIEKFDSSGRYLMQWGTFGDGNQAPLTPTQLYGPRAIAVDPDGNLLVTDTGNKRVLKFDSQGKSLGEFGSAGGDPGQFLEPVGVAVDSQGNIYVADTWNQRIQKFDKDFNPLQQWSVQAWDGQSVVNKPYLAVDAGGNVYFTDPEGYRLVKFSNSGQVLAVWGSRGNNLGSFELPTGLTIGPDGKIYVADSGNNRILIFAPVK